jgi:predicted Rossmann-fold nucleotide-binding protein
MDVVAVGIHQKPCAFLNVNGFYDDLLKMIQGTVDKALLITFCRKLIVSDQIDVILKPEHYQPAAPKWGAQTQVHP